MFSILHRISSFARLFTKLLKDANYDCYDRHLHLTPRLFFAWKLCYFSSFSFSFVFLLLSDRTAKFSRVYIIVLVILRLYLGIRFFHKVLDYYRTFIFMERFWFAHLTQRLNFKFLHKIQVDYFLPLVLHVLKSFCGFLFLWLIEW